MSAPLVSIVLPFLDAERFLPEALASVFAQSYRGWELILVDDGSIDRSTTIAKQAASASPERVVYAEHEGHRNAGLPASRNMGTERARGRWIAMLDSDDVWLAQKLERQLAVAEDQPTAELIFGRAEYWSGGEDAESDGVPEFEALSGLYDPPQLLLETILGHWMPPPPSDIMFTRDLWQRVGEFEPRLPAVYEDQVFLAKCMAAAAAYVATETWTRYRRHVESLEATVAADSELAYAERMRFVRWLCERFAAHPDPFVRAAVAKLSWPVQHPGLHKALSRTRRTLLPRR
jgi:glycosyltransferase involved in cell wall biosynthesis